MSPHRLLALLALLVLAGFTGCARRDSAQALKAGTLTTKIHVYVIALKDRGAAGRPTGCGDSVVPMEMALPTPAPALKGALSSLLTLHNGADTKGLYNALAHSPLKIDRIDRTGPEARVYLSGYVEIGDNCDGPRILSQLTETALQFHDLKHAQFFLDGKPLQSVLSGKA